MPKRCHGCMKVKENSPVCEHCGYNENIPNYPHQLPIGTMLKGSYTVGKVLGQGGFGITYIGWDNALEAPIAIKEYYPNSFVTRESAFSLEVHCAGEGAEELFRHNRERFLKEAKILAKLQSVPGIVRVQNLFAENNTAYIVMEYVEGIDLKHYIRMQNRCLTVQETLSVLRPVMYALSKVHEAELVHRDISPDNIMILPDGSAKLLDFGAAREVENADVYAELPQSTEAILKHGFAPMEQYRRRGSLGPWTDVYALCATMYYCLTGKVPNSAPERIMGDDNVNWHRIPGLNEQQIQTLEKGLALMPENRLRTMEQLYRGLFSQREQTTAPRPAPKESKRVPEQRKQVSPVVETKKKKKKPTALIAAGLAVVAAAGLFFLKPGEKDITVDLPEIDPAATEATEEVILTPEQLQYMEAEALETAGEYGKAAIAFGKLGDYKDARERSFALWEKITYRETLPTNWTKQDNWWDKAFVGLRTDGTVASAFPPVDSVTEWTDIIAVESGSYPDGCFVMGLKKDGTVVTTIANNEYTEYDTSNWTDIVAIDARNGTAVGLKADGTVVAIGTSNWFADLDLSKVSAWTDIVSVYTTGSCTIGLKADGTVVACGNGAEQISGWTDIASISVSGDIIGIKKNGTLVASGIGGARTEDISDWTDIIAVDTNAWGNNIVGLRSDGTVVAVGPDNDHNKIAVSGWSDIVEVYTTDNYTIGLRSDGTVVGTGLNINGCLNVEKWTDIVSLRVWYGCTVGIKSEGTVVFAGKGHAAMNNWTDIKAPGISAAAAQDSVENSPAMGDKESAYAAAEEETTYASPCTLSKDWFSRFSVSYEIISSIHFTDTVKDAPTNALDVSEAENGKVLAWLSENSGKKDLHIGAEGGVYAPSDCHYLFAWFTNAQAIYFNDAFHTTGVTSMRSMFQGCSSLTELDLSGFDTSQVTDMSAMFCTCSKLTTLDVSHFDTARVSRMDYMFSECTSPMDLDLSSWDVSNVGTMYQMFFKFSWMGRVDLTGWDVSNVGNYDLFMENGRTIDGQPWEALFTQ